MGVKGFNYRRTDRPLTDLWRPQHGGTWTLLSPIVLLHSSPAPEAWDLDTSLADIYSCLSFNSCSNTDHSSFSPLQVLSGGHSVIQGPSNFWSRLWGQNIWKSSIHKSIHSVCERWTQFKLTFWPLWRCRIQLSEITCLCKGFSVILQLTELEFRIQTFIFFTDIKQNNTQGCLDNNFVVNLSLRFQRSFKMKYCCCSSIFYQENCCYWLLT